MIHHLASNIDSVSSERHQPASCGHRRSRPRALAGMLLGALIACSALSSCTLEKSISWHTWDVSLEAEDFYIDIGGTRFYGNTDEVEVRENGSPMPNATSLQISWRENDADMQLYIHFTSDGQDWWADEIMTYDGSAENEWVSYTGEFFRRPLGTPFQGDLDISSEINGTPTTIHFLGLELEAFLPPTGCGVRASGQGLCSR